MKPRIAQKGTKQTKLSINRCRCGQKPVKIFVPLGLALPEITHSYWSFWCDAVHPKHRGKATMAHGDTRAEAIHNWNLLNLPRP